MVKLNPYYNLNLITKKKKTNKKVTYRGWPDYPIS
jgi:hypothetical protein